MSDAAAADRPDAEPAEAVETPGHTDVDLAYAGPSTLVSEGDSATLSLVANRHRPAVRFEAALRDPLPFREAMAALHAVVGSDYRYVPKDRTAYLADRRMKAESAHLGLWEAQRAYFSWLMRNDPTAYLILDPVVTAHPDQVFFEVFSKDEGTYAKLGVDLDAFEPDPAVSTTWGTTNIDFSEALHLGIEQMRSYRTTRLSLGLEGVSVATEGAGAVLEKTVRVPDSWLRGFLQVQSAAALPRTSFSLNPIDLYNALRQLRMHADQKGRRRGIRLELVPGEPPRLVLEPWETVIRSSAAPFSGPSARVFRVWGRRRLFLLRRFLPLAREVDVHLLGSGLPSFWVLRAGPITLTLGLTGFTAANWSQAISFDLLLPRKTQESSKELDAVLAHLSSHWKAGAGELLKATKLTWEPLIEALQLGCQQGRIMYDLAADVYRLRPLTDAPIDLARLEYRNQRERIAHDLVARRGAVTIVSENRIATAGLELTGRVEVAEDRREYRPVMLLSEEGQVSKAECTCPLFRRQGLKDGPCAHLIALRMALAERETLRRRGLSPTEALTAETRVFSRRDDRGEDVSQLSLDRQRLTIHWGRAGSPMRRQRLAFDSVEDARTAYLSRVDRLTGLGFLDASSS
ncbi:SWIM zinc finger family protein [Tautonia sociabilis]|uniref:SWIM zinc finger family protein n=1 Tax=Tautonia sociabilis TaxID=2080755 RepID=A0A432MI66_9BACT|nr:SWIM zinc finger family protein [Tautonia sociabilis]RUL87064.1 SWIM zinc finger family protein [Tautonia sociabilis]